MSDLIKTLRSSSTGDDVYPNIKEDNIPSGAVTSAKIGTGAVITGKINDGAVTTNKISDGAVDYNKLALALKNLIDGKASNYDLSLVQNALTTHVGNTSNPHSVTKAQVGLGNVDNTSDANKPVSTATQGALDLKADKSTTYTKTEVDTALSGKASLSGDNTFTGENNFTGELKINDNYVATENYVDNALSDMQDKLYKHDITISFYLNYEASIYDLHIISYNTSSTPFTKTTLPNGNYNIIKKDTDEFSIEYDNEYMKVVGFLGLVVSSNEAQEIYVMLQNSNKELLCTYIDRGSGEGQFDWSESIVSDTITAL